MNIAVITEDATTRTLLANIAQQRGHTSVAFATGAAAWPPLLTTGDTRLLVIAARDEREGLEMCRRARQEPWGDEIMVVLIGRYTESSTLAVALDAGADDILPLPLDPVLLEMCVAVAERDAARHGVRRAAAEQSRSLLAAIVDSSDDAIIGKTLDGLIMSWNSGAERTYGYTADEVLGRSIAVLVPPDCPDEVPHILAQVRGGEGITQYETVRVRKDGQRINVALTISPIRDAQGRITGAATIARDVSERKQVDATLRASEERYRRIVETAAEGIWIVDAAVTVTYVNQRTATLLGYTIDELVGTSMLRHVAPEDDPLANAVVARLEQGMGEQVEIRLRRKDGTIIWVQANASPLMDAHGQYSGVLTMGTDITERKEAEAALRQSEHRLRTVVDHAPLALFALDRDGRFTLSEGQALRHVGLQPGEHVGLNIFAISRERPAVVQAARRALAGESLTIMETVRGRTFETHWQPLRDDRGAITGAQGVALDITERIQAEQERERQLAREQHLRATAEHRIDRQQRLQHLTTDLADALSQEQVGQAVLTQGLAMFDAVAGTVLLLSDDGTALRLLAVSGPLSVVAHLPSSMPLTSVPVVAEALRRREAILMETPDEMAGADAETAAQRTAMGIAAAGVLPLLAGERVIGALNFAFAAPRPFTLEDRTFFALLGDLCGQALERTRLFEALHASEEQYRRIVETALEGIWRVDAHGITTFVNQQMATLLGTTVEEMLGQSRLTFSVPEDQANMREALDRRQGGNAERLEVRLRRTDGTTLWALAAASPIVDAQGQYVGAVAMISDITVRKQAEDQLRFQAHLLDTVGQAVTATDPQGRVTYWNRSAARLYGWTADDALGRQVEEVIAAPDAHTQAQVEEIQAHLAAGREWVGEQHQRRRDGRIFPAMVTATPVFDAQGAAIGAVGITSDITQQKEAEAEIRRLNTDLEQRVIERTAQADQARAEAERANAAKSEFLSRMSHELRTPLNAILGFAQLLEFSPLSVDDSESVAHILKGGRHLLGLINEVLDIARVEAGHLTLSLESVAVDMLLAECLDLVRPLAAQQRIVLQVVDVETGAGHLRADAQRLKQVLLNLLSNAIKYNHPGGTVTLTTVQRVPGWVRLAVEDTGPGMDPADLAQLFTPFQRLRAEERRIEGTGLGLVLSRHLVEAMEGTLGVQSTVGVGSTFWVELPQADGLQEQFAAPAVPVAALDTPPALPARTLLYIEDNLSNVTLMKHVLGRRPEITLLAAMQGSLGLDLAREHYPDLILLDQHLPDMDGDEVLRRLQDDVRTHAIPVVMLSADAMPHQMERVLAAGARAYLTKPLNIAQFLVMIDTYLAVNGGS